MPPKRKAKSAAGSCTIKKRVIACLSPECVKKLVHPEYWLSTKTWTAASFAEYVIREHPDTEIKSIPRVFQSELAKVHAGCSAPGYRDKAKTLSEGMKTKEILDSDILAKPLGLPAVKQRHQVYRAHRAEALTGVIATKATYARIATGDVVQGLLSPLSDEEVADEEEGADEREGVVMEEDGDEEEAVDVEEDGVEEKVVDVEETDRMVGVDEDLASDENQHEDDGEKEEEEVDGNYEAKDDQSVAGKESFPSPSPFPSPSHQTPTHTCNGYKSSFATSSSPENMTEITKPSSASTSPVTPIIIANGKASSSSSSSPHPTTTDKSSSPATPTHLSEKSEGKLESASVSQPKANDDMVVTANRATATSTRKSPSKSKGGRKGSSKQELLPPAMAGLGPNITTPNKLPLRPEPTSLLVKVVVALKGRREEIGKNHPDLASIILEYQNEKFVPDDVCQFIYELSEVPVTEAVQNFADVMVGWDGDVRKHIAYHTLQQFYSLVRFIPGATLPSHKSERKFLVERVATMLSLLEHSSGDMTWAYIETPFRPRPQQIQEVLNEAVNGLRAILCDYLDINVDLVRKVRSYGIHIIKDRLTLMCIQLIAPNTFAAIELKSARVP
ncbi:hypothetical protein HK104_006100 [Borealophlyctis nickersoniae]|nr:hypothetical protein HK104_006100 [Borealophlyctis nickersoniae]